MPLIGIGGMTVVFLLLLGFLALVDMVPRGDVRPFTVLSTVAYLAALGLETGLINV